MSGTRTVWKQEVEEATSSESIDSNSETDESEEVKRTEEQNVMSKQDAVHVQSPREPQDSEQSRRVFARRDSFDGKNH